MLHFSQPRDVEDAVPYKIFGVLRNDAVPYKIFSMLCKDALPYDIFLNRGTSRTPPPTYNRACFARMLSPTMDEK